MNNCQLSVIIPTHNRSKMLQDSVRSVQNSRVREVEIIVVDNCSTDDTESIFKKSMDVKYYRLEENQGPSQARNWGFQKCSSAYVAFLDDDDMWLPTVPSRVVDLLNKYPVADVIFADAHTGNDQDGYRSWIEISGQSSFFELPCIEPEPNFRILETSSFFKKMLARNAIFGGAMIMRSDVFRSKGMYAPHQTYAEDWEMYLRMLARGVRFGFLMEPMGIYKKHRVEASEIPQSSYNAEKMQAGFCWALENIISNETIHLKINEIKLVRSNLNKHLFYYAYSAWRKNDFKLAHKRFADSIHRGGSTLLVLFYFIITLLPEGLLKLLKRIKYLLFKQI